MVAQGDTYRGHKERVLDSYLSWEKCLFLKIKEPILARQCIEHILKAVVAKEPVFQIIEFDKDTIELLRKTYKVPHAIKSFGGTFCLFLLHHENVRIIDDVLYKKIEQVINSGNSSGHGIHAISVSAFEKIKDKFKTIVNWFFIDKEDEKDWKINKIEPELNKLKQIDPTVIAMEVATHLKEYLKELNTNREEYENIEATIKSIHQAMSSLDTFKDEIIGKTKTEIRNIGNEILEKIESTISNRDNSEEGPKIIIAQTKKDDTPSIEFAFGVSPAYKPEEDETTSFGRFLDKVAKYLLNPKKVEYPQKNYKTSTLFFGANTILGSEFIVGIPYWIINNSDFPAYNITIVLEYSSAHAVKKFPHLKGIDENGEVQEFIETKDYWHREVHIRKSRAQIRYTVKVLRPGDRLPIVDPMNFTKLPRTNEVVTEETDLYPGILRELRKNEKFNDFVAVDVTIFSENSNKIENRIKLLWYDTDSMEELCHFSKDSMRAFWGGKFPRSGNYIRLIHYAFTRKKEIRRTEYGEILLPEMYTLKLSDGRYLYYWDTTLNFKQDALIVMFMPTWDYYKLSGTEDAEQLIAKTTGFVKT